MTNMAEKEQLRNDIMVAMTAYMDGCMARILEAVLTEKLQAVEMVRMETLPTTGISDNEYIIKLFIARKGPKLSRRTMEQYMLSIKALIQTVDKSLLQMTDMDIEYFLLEYGRKGNSDVTVNNVRRNLSAVYTWLRKSHLVMENPVDNTEVRRVTEKPVDHLEEYELEQLRDSCKDLRDRALFEFLRSTGVRIGEVPAITKSAVSWKDGSIVLYAPKTRRYRTVFLDDAARYHMKKYIDSRTDGSDSLFVSKKVPHGRMREEGLRESIKRIALNAAVGQRVYPHLFRKTFATRLNERGCPMGMIQDLMGHSNGSPVTKRFYIATDKRQLEQAHRQYR